MDKIKVEYLLPNLTDTRKLEWLQQASFKDDVTEQEALKFTYEEFAKAIGEYHRNKFNEQGSKRTEGEIKSYYEAWLERANNKFSNDIIDNLYATHFAWSDDLLEKIADYLAKEPLALPRFLTRVTDNILSHFLGGIQLFRYLYNEETGNIFRDQRLDPKEYQESIFYAKYRLTLLINIINKLLAKGVNLHELFFVNFKDTYNFEDSSKDNLWHTKLIQNLSTESFTRCDGHVFSKEELKEILGYTNLEEFLDVISKLVDIEHLHVFIPETRTLNPNTIMEVPYGEYDMASFGNENLVSVQDICKETKRSIEKVGLEAEITVTNRNLESLKQKLSFKPQEDTEIESLKVQIKSLYAEIGRLPIIYGKNLREALDTIVKESEIKIVEEVPELDNDKMQELLARLNKLEARMDKTEKRVASLEEQVLNYLINGGTNPINANTDISKEQIIRILLQFKPKNKEELSRRNNMLRSLKVSVLTIFGSLLLLNLPGSTPINDITTPNDTPVAPPTYTETIPEPPQVSPRVEVSIPSSEPTDIITSEPVESSPILKDNEEIALEVIRGTWQDGEERRRLLEEAGYDPNVIQSIVNDIWYGRISLEELQAKYSGVTR